MTAIFSQPKSTQKRRFFASAVATSLIVGVLSLTACQDKTALESAKQDAPSALVGCYTVVDGEPAQIKINQDGTAFSMQMKERAGSKQVWDKPEVLDELSVEQGWHFFHANALDLNKSDVEQIVARPDKMMALAKIKDDIKNINPRLDSAYVIYVVNSANTVYQVACDDKADKNSEK